MSDPSWADGYVVDVDYTDGYYRELSPGLLRFVALLGGVEASNGGDGFTYCELGCGNGRSVALHAAADPRGRYFGVDFNPAHINNARRLARDAGLENAVFLEKSFAELLASDVPEMDAITLHGVYSWITEENRRHIVEFIRRKLKPGGLVYVSYNCLPGLAPVQPLQRLLASHAAHDRGELLGRIGNALGFANRLEQCGAGYFRLNPLAKVRLDALRKQNPAYLAHEYFNANWLPAYHADVGAEMSGAKLAYVGSATLSENFDQFSLAPDVARLIAGLNDRALAETARDFARNTVFRRDVFARGASRSGPRDLETLLGRQRFCLAVPRSICRLVAKVTAGDVTLEAEIHAPVLDLLALAPMSFDELAAHPQTAHLNRSQLRQAVFALAAIGQIFPALPGSGEAERRESCRKFNAVTLARPSASSGYGNTLVSPVIGFGLQMGYVDLLLLAAPRNERDAIVHALRGIAASGFKPVSNGLVIEEPAQVQTVVEGKAKAFFSDLLPFLRLHGIAE